MKQRRSLLGTSFITLTLGVTFFVACGSGSSGGGGFAGGDDGSASSSGSSGGSSSSGSSSGNLVGDGSMSNYDAMMLGEGDFGNDPPPPWCGMGPDPDDAGVYGTVQCPSDKNREGCPCPKANEMAPCWTGLRADRGVGICKDGMTQCEPASEGPLEWGPCVGEVLPNPGADAGAQACKCFSTGQWAIKNVEPCLAENGSMQVTGAVSTYIDSSGTIQCPTNPAMPQPGTTWSPDTVSTDCAGNFTLCYTIKAGSATNPQSTDCVVGQACTMGYVPAPSMVTTLPDLPAWTGTNVACAQQFATTGGYGEMSVYGESVRCEMIGSMGTPYVFGRNSYCPLINPPSGCVSGGSGNF